MEHLVRRLRTRHMPTKVEDGGKITKKERKIARDQLRKLEITYQNCKIDEEEDEDGHIC